MPNDFVETNVIIGYTVDWDRQASIVQQYVESRARTADLHTCTRVLDEAEDVVNDRLRAAKQAARLVFQDFETGEHRPPVDQVIDFVRREMSHLRDTVVDHVIQHIRDNEYYYTGLTQSDSANVLSSTVSDVDSDFDDAIAVIRSIRTRSCSELDCEIFTDGLRDYSNCDVFDDVDRILSGSPNDRDILLDSYHLTQEDGIRTLYFVTMDRDLLDNESQIESLLDPIDIEAPDSVT